MGLGQASLSGAHRDTVMVITSVTNKHSNSKQAIPNSENKKSSGKTRTAQWWRRGGLRRPQPAKALAAVYNIKARILLLFSMLSCAEKEA